MSPGRPGPGAGRTNAKYGLRVYLMLASAVLNGLLVVALLWVVGQVGIRTLAEEAGIVEPRRPAYDTYAAEQFDGLPGAAVVVVGDSHAQYGPWGEILDRPVAVRGQAGALTAEVEHWVAGTAMSGQATIVLAGTNDVLTGTPLRQLRQDAERLYRATPGRVLAIGVPPLVGMEDQAAAANAVLQEAADAAGVEWWDPTEALSSPGMLRRDGVHLTGRGYEAMRERIATLTDVSRSLVSDP